MPRGRSRWAPGWPTQESETHRGAACSQSFVGGPWATGIWPVVQVAGFRGVCVGQPDVAPGGRDLLECAAGKTFPASRAGAQPGRPPATDGAG